VKNLFGGLSSSSPEHVINVSDEVLQSGDLVTWCKKESFSRTPVHVWEPSPAVNELNESLLSSDESFVRRHQGRCEKYKEDNDCLNLSIKNALSTC
jgi:hypothetical protein